MTVTLKKGLFLLLTLLFIGACGRSDIGYTHNSLSLGLEDNRVLLDASLLHQSRQNFKTVSIDKKVLRLKEGNIVVYEDANTDLSYEFARSTTSTIRVLFNAHSVSKVYARHNLYGFQLLLANNRVLNVIAQQSESQQLRFLYGLSTRQFNRILKTLDPAAPTAAVSNVLTFTSAQQPLMARWTTMNVDFLPLVHPVPQRLGW